MSTLISLPQLIAVLLPLACAPLCSCGKQSAAPSRSEQRQPSDSSRDAGSVVSPTNDRSFELLGADPEARRLWLQTAVRKRNGACAVPLSTVLIAGDSGVDLWRVECSDATWLVTLDENGVRSIEICSAGSAVEYCRGTRG